MTILKKRPLKIFSRHDSGCRIPSGGEWNPSPIRPRWKQFRRSCSSGDFHVSNFWGGIGLSRRSSSSSACSAHAMAAIALAVWLVEALRQPRLDHPSQVREYAYRSFTTLSGADPLETVTVMNNGTCDCCLVERQNGEAMAIW